jgi:hypothetical protein
VKTNELYNVNIIVGRTAPEHHRMIVKYKLMAIYRQSSDSRFLIYQGINGKKANESKTLFEFALFEKIYLVLLNIKNCNGAVC